MKVGMIVFDFDGVVADSEGLACEVLARLAREAGVPMTLEEALDRFTGKRLSEVTSTIETLAGRPLPNFATHLQQRTLSAFEKDLHEVAGLGRFLLDHSHLRRCIASSSTTERIRFCLGLLGLSAAFPQGIFSAESVSRGKPFPDIFMRAAELTETAAADIVVIEDSKGGVQAAAAAGMHVIGLLAGSHVRKGHAEALKIAGADFIARSYEEVAAILRN